jgi:hypothetical protein
VNGASGAYGAFWPLALHILSAPFFRSVQAVHCHFHYCVPEGVSVMGIRRSVDTTVESVKLHRITRSRERTNRRATALTGGSDTPALGTEYGVCFVLVLALCQRKAFGTFHGTEAAFGFLGEEYGPDPWRRFAAHSS